MNYLFFYIPALTFGLYNGINFAYRSHIDLNSKDSFITTIYIGTSFLTGFIIGFFIGFVWPLSIAIYLYSPIDLDP